MSGGSGALLVALVAIVPIVILMMTSFVKLSVVLSLLRNAIGAPDAPSGLVVMGISLVLTFFVMAPVAVDMINAATTPAPSGASTTPGSPSGTATAVAAPAADTSVTPSGPTAAAGSDAIAAAGTTDAAGSAGVANANANAAAAAGSDAAPVAGAPVDFETAVRKLVPASYRGDVDAGMRAIAPLKAFLRNHSSDRDRGTFSGLAVRMGRGVTGDELWVLAPAFLATELREAFAIAVLIFIPFLVIDLVVGLGLAALGLQNTQAQSVALPLKLLLFVAVDGWRLLLESLLRGYV